MRRRYPRRPVRPSMYHDPLGDLPLLTVAEERTLVERLASGDLTARDILIRANLRLVPGIARRYVNRGLSLDDLIGEGNAGLIVAIDRFDTRFGTRVSTYATYWIRQAIMRAVEEQGATVRVPGYTHDLISEYLKDPKAFGRAKSPSELESVQLGLVAMSSRHAASLSLGGDDLPDPRQAPRPNDRSEVVAMLMACLDPNERMVISRRYPLDREGQDLQWDIGKGLKVTRAAVAKIERRALRKMLAAANRLGWTYERIVA